MSAPIKETVSKKGRPLCTASAVMQDLPKELIPVGTHRTQVDRVYMLHAMSQLQPLLSEHDCMSKGAYTALVEIGRYLMAGRQQPDTLMFIQTARGDGVGWTRIKRHFRQLRLGERRSKCGSLAGAIRRTIDEHRKRFPLTDGMDIADALVIAGLAYQDKAQ